MDDAVIAVDWSGRAARPDRYIWRAVVADGVVTLASGLDRAATIEVVIRDARRATRCAVGLDFSFAFPAWFSRTLGAERVDDLWRVVTDEGERWLATCPPPFWGARGSHRPDKVAVLRATEEPRRYPKGARPFSTFQIAGAGAVGTGSIRGMPYLAHVRSAGISIWPFDPPGPRRVVEIYPRLFTGPVVKRDRAARIARLESLDAETVAINGDVWSAAAASEDAFDALVSALAMWARRDELGSLVPSSDAEVRLEGWVFGVGERVR